MLIIDGFGFIYLLFLDKLLANCIFKTEKHKYISADWGHLHLTKTIYLFENGQCFCYVSCNKSSTTVQCPLSTENLKDLCNRIRHLYGIFKCLKHFPSIIRIMHTTSQQAKQDHYNYPCTANLGVDGGRGWGWENRGLATDTCWTNSRDNIWTENLLLAHSSLS